MINCKIVADSINPQGDRITSMLLTYPRMPLSSGFYIDDKKTEGWCNNFRGWIQYRYLIENKV
jgi:hypothetical protein